MSADGKEVMLVTFIVADGAIMIPVLTPVPSGMLEFDNPPLVADGMIPVLAAVPMDMVAFDSPPLVTEGINPVLAAVPTIEVKFWRPSEVVVG